MVTLSTVIAAGLTVGLVQFTFFSPPRPSEWHHEGERIHVSEGLRPPKELASKEWHNDGWNDRLIANLRVGTASYSAYDTMWVGESKPIELIVIPKPDSTSLPELSETRSEGARIVTASVRLGPIMRAELVGEDFDITPVGPPEQQLAQQSHTAWSWFVKPKASGPKRLFLTLSVVGDDEGRERTRRLSVLRHRIEVIALPTVNLTQATEQAPSADSVQRTGSVRRTEQSSEMTPRLWVGSVFLLLMFGFLWYAYTHPGVEHQGYVILRLISSLCAGFAGGLFTGEALFQLQASAGVKFGLTGTAGFAMFILIWRTFPPEAPVVPVSPRGENGFNFHAPEGCTFEQGADIIARMRRAVVRMDELAPSERQAPLQSREVHANDAKHALELLRDLAPRDQVRAYDVQYSDSVYRITPRANTES